MASKVEICNQALLRLGQPPIMSDTDNSPRARLCFQEFDAALGATLRSYPWPFAIVRKELARKVEGPAFGFAYYYPLPGDMVRLVEIFTSQHKYQLEQNMVATNAEAVAIRYVSKDINIGLLDDQIVDAIALSLASRLAISITENMQLKDMLHVEYQQALATARNTWAVEDYPQQVEEGVWLDAHDNGLRVARNYQKNIWDPWGPEGTGVSG